MDPQEPPARGTPPMVALVVLVAAMGGAWAGTASSGSTLADPLLAAAAAAVVAVAASRARPWSLFPALAVGVAVGSAPLAPACGVLGLAAATWALVQLERKPLFGAVAGALAAQALLRLSVPGPLGIETGIAWLAASVILLSGYRAAEQAHQRRARRLGCAALGVGAALTALGAASATNARSAVDRGTAQIQDGLEAARKGDSQAAADAFGRANRSFGHAQSRLDAWWAVPARLLPIAGPNLRVAAAAATAATNLTAAGQQRLTVAPDADLTVHDGTVPIKAFASLERPLQVVWEAEVDALRRLEPQRRSPWELGVVRAGLDELLVKLEDATDSTEVALSAVRTLPDFFGAGGQRRYLALFVTPVEGRASGFPGNYAELLLTDGKMEMTEFGRINELDRVQGAVSVSLPADYQARYARFGSADSWRNITLSPDFPSVAELVRQLYPQSGGAELDGVLSVDPAALSALLRLTGPVEVPGIRRVLTARNAERFLLRDQYLELADNPNRVDALEVLGRRTFDALLTRDLPRPEQIAKVLSPEFIDQHLRIVAFDPDVSRFFERIDVTGALPNVAGDALAVTTNNIIGNKVDLFLQRTVDYEAVWDPATRTVESVVRIHLVNQAPGSGLPDYVIGNSLPDGADVPKGTNRTYLSVFTPLALANATLDGQPLPLEAQREAGRHVFSTFLDLGPDGGEATVELRLSGVLPGTSGYRLDVFPQVLAQPDLLQVTVRRADTVLVAATRHRLGHPESYSE